MRDHQPTQIDAADTASGSNADTAASEKPIHTASSPPASATAQSSASARSAGDAQQEAQNKDDCKGASFETSFRKKLANSEPEAAKLLIENLQAKVLRRPWEIEEQTGWTPNRLKVFLDGVQHDTVRQEMLSMTLGALKRRARQEGIADTSLIEVDDADEPREAAITLIMEATWPKLSQE